MLAIATSTHARRFARATCALLPLLALACGSVAAENADENTELGSVEQPAAFNPTESHNGEIFGPGTMEPANDPTEWGRQYFALNYSAANPVEVVVPITKTVSVFIDPVADYADLRNMVGEIVGGIKNDVNFTNGGRWPGPLWSITMRAASFNATPIPLKSRLWIVDDCSLPLNTVFPSNDVRRYFSVFRWGNWNQLSTQFPNGWVPDNTRFWTVDGETELKVNTCEIANLVGGGWSDRVFNRITMHTISLGMRIAKFGQGALPNALGTCSNPNHPDHNTATCAYMEPNVWKSLASPWQDCLAKQLDTSKSSGLFRWQDSFHCPASN